VLLGKLCASGQVAGAGVSIGETFVDTSFDITLEKLQLTERVLNDLRQEQHRFCQKNNMKESYCVWIHSMPPEFGDGVDNIQFLYSPPYHAYDLGRIKSVFVMRTLVPVQSVSDGSSTLHKWNQMADAGDLFGCYDPVLIERVPRTTNGATLRPTSTRQEKGADVTPAKCLVIVRNHPRRPPRVLSICEVVYINGVAGAPESCFPIAASFKSSDWMLADVALVSIIVADNGTPDFLVHLFHSPRVGTAFLKSNTSLQVQDVLKVAEIAMSGPPLLLTTRIKNDVLGVAPRRTSTVLGRPWNEQVTVRIDVTESRETENDQATGHNFTLEVATSILVNEQKDADPSHWHAPSPAQAQSWNDAIRKRLTEEMNNLCPHAMRKDDYTVVCNNP